MRHFALAFIVILLDQLTKNIVISTLEIGEKISLGIMDINLITNPGITFGMMQGQSTIAGLLALLITIYLVYYMSTNKLEHKTHWIGAGLVLGGAIGNLIDRLRFNYVVDFLDFGWWPAFNISDTSICIGAALLILYFWKFEKQNE